LRLRERSAGDEGADIVCRQFVRSLPTPFQIGAEFVSGERRAFLNSDTMDAEEIHVGSDSELPARLPVVAHIESISARILSLLKSQIPDFH